jgi:hypothetical protein
MNTQTKQIDWVKVFAIVTAIVFAFLWLKGCAGSNPEPQLAKVEVMVPEVSGTFKPQKPINTPVVKWSNMTISKQTQNLPKIGKSYFDKSKKSIVQNSLFEVDAIHSDDSIQKEPCERQLNNFSTKFEDDNIELNIEGVAEGTVKEITPRYKLKERKSEGVVEQKETVLRVLAGGGFGINKDLNQATWKLNLGLQNKKGNIIRGSFQRIGNQDYWLAEYDVSIFNFKR